MISGQTLRVCPEGKPVPVFPDQALNAEIDQSLEVAQRCIRCILHKSPRAKECSLGFAGSIKPFANHLARLDGTNRHERAAGFDANEISGLPLDFF